VHLPRGVKVRSASAGLLHSLALTTTGRVLAWGDNADGQLGIGTVTGHSVPVFVHLPKTVHIVSVAAGRYHSLALNRSGKVLAWGDGGDGQLGNGTQTNETLPVQIMVPGKVIAIGSACESDSSIAVLTKIID
jgi:alpha-tubulin suppressor-like RCC1 family protein